MQSLVFCGQAAFSFRAHTNTTQAQYTIYKTACRPVSAHAMAKRAADGTVKDTEVKPEPVANTEKEADGNDEQRSPVMLEPVFGMCHNWSDDDC